MAQFRYVNELTSVLNLDGPLTKGPMSRWQRKGLENSSSGNSSLNQSQKSILQNISTSKSPSSNKSGTDVLRAKKTPSKTPSKSKSPGRSKTPTPNKGSKTPNIGDRFIPCRSANNFELAHYKLNMENVPDSPTQKMMMENLHGTDM